MIPMADTRQHLTRSSADRQVAGVAGGLARSLGVQTGLVRGAMVGLTLAGWGRLAWPVPLAYLAAWLVLPTDDGPSILRRLFSAAGAQEAAAAVLLTTIVIGTVAGSNLWLTVFLALAAFLFRDLWAARSPTATTGPTPPIGYAEPAATTSSTGATPSAASSPSTESTPSIESTPLAESTPSAESTPLAESTPSAGATEPTRVAAGVGVVSPLAGSVERATRWGRSFRSARGETVVDPDEEAVPGPLARLVDRRPNPQLMAWFHRPRRQPALWPLTLAALVIWFVATISLDRLVHPGIPPGVIVDGALIIVGAVLVLSAWRGRAGLVTWLTLLPLGFVWLMVSPDNVARYPFDGVQNIRPAAVEAGDTLRFTGGYGRLDIDLTAIDLEPGEQVTVDVRQTAGDIYLTYPATMALTGTADVSFGAVSAPRRWANGFILPLTLDEQPCEIVAAVIDPLDYPADVPTADIPPLSADGPTADIPPLPADCETDPAVIVLDLDAGVSAVDIYPVEVQNR